MDPTAVQQAGGHHPRVTGLLILGWGLFNLVEGIIDHHILGLHHVRDLPAHVPLYDWLFLGIGGVRLILVGWALSRESRIGAPGGASR